MTLPLFSHTEKRYLLYKSHAGGPGHETVIRVVLHHLAEHREEQIETLGLKTNAIPPAVTAAFVACAVLTLPTYWLDNRMPDTAEETDVIRAF